MGVIQVVLLVVLLLVGGVFLLVGGMGQNFTMVSITSVVTVFIAPVIMMVACLCINASLVTMACLDEGCCLVVVE